MTDYAALSGHLRLDATAFREGSVFGTAFATRQKLADRLDTAAAAINALLANVAGCEQTIRHAEGERQILEAQAEALTAERDTLRGALERIRQRAECYPDNIFGEPDLVAVKEVLAANGMTVQMDRMHASWGRRIMNDIGNEARAILKGTTDEG